MCMKSMAKILKKKKTKRGGIDIKLILKYESKK
jgi:hypothetical protein